MTPEKRILRIAVAMILTWSTTSMAEGNSPYTGSYEAINTRSLGVVGIADINARGEVLGYTENGHTVIVRNGSKAEISTPALKHLNNFGQATGSAWSFTAGYESFYFDGAALKKLDIPSNHRVTGISDSGLALVQGTSNGNPLERTSYLYSLTNDIKVYEPENLFISSLSRAGLIAGYSSHDSSITTGIFNAATNEYQPAWRKAIATLDTWAAEINFEVADSGRSLLNIGYNCATEEYPCYFSTFSAFDPTGKPTLESSGGSFAADLTSSGAFLLHPNYYEYSYTDTFVSLPTGEILSARELLASTNYLGLDSVMTVNVEAIGDDGSIAIRISSYVDDQQQSFLLVPASVVPEPSQFLLLLCGLVVALCAEPKLRQWSSSIES